MTEEVPKIQFLLSDQNTILRVLKILGGVGATKVDMGGGDKKRLEGLGYTQGFGS